MLLKNRSERHILKWKEVYCCISLKYEIVGSPTGELSPGDFVQPFVAFLKFNLGFLFCVKLVHVLGLFSQSHLAVFQCTYFICNLIFIIKSV